MENTFKCSVCKETKSFVPKGVTTGYGLDENDNKVCYDCCAEKDKKVMREQGKISLYLSNDNLKYKVTNWPGTLCFIPYHVTTGRHNIAGIRYDVWFLFEGKSWHGTTYGNNTQICHCKRAK